MYDGFSFCMLISFETPDRLLRTWISSKLFARSWNRKCPRYITAFFPLFFCFFKIAYYYFLLGIRKVTTPSKDWAFCQPHLHPFICLPFVYSGGDTRQQPTGHAAAACHHPARTRWCAEAPVGAHGCVKTTPQAFINACACARVWECTCWCACVYVRVCLCALTCAFLTRWGVFCCFVFFCYYIPHCMSIDKYAQHIYTAHIGSFWFTVFYLYYVCMHRAWTNGGAWLARSARANGAVLELSEPRACPL